MRDVRAPAVAAAALALVAGSGACASFDFLTQVDSRQPAAADCGSCHVEIYEEFAQSAHAQAWVRPDYVAATADHAITDCLGCHAPETIYSDGVPRARSARRDEGVTCISCHFDQGVMVGPVDAKALAEPHPVAVRRDIYVRSDLCGRCHEGTFREWQAAPVDDKPTCQGCHMERVTRTVTQATSAVSTVLVAFEGKVEGRRHTFHVPLSEVTDDALTSALEGVRREGEELRCELVLTNRLPHLVPTGDFGYRRVAIATEALSPSGTILARSEESLFKELRTALRPLEPRRIPLSLPPGTSSVRVTVTTGKRTGPRTTLHARTFPVQ